MKKWEKVDLVQNGKGCKSITYNLFECPGQDSNLHVLSNTTTSKWLVYQFQHLGAITLSGLQM